MKNLIFKKGQNLQRKKTGLKNRILREVKMKIKKKPFLVIT